MKLFLLTFKTQSPFSNITITTILHCRKVGLEGWRGLGYMGCIQMISNKLHASYYSSLYLHNNLLPVYKMFIHHSIHIYTVVYNLLSFCIYITFYFMLYICVYTHIYMYIYTHTNMHIYIYTFLLYFTYCTLSYLRF